MNNVSHRRWWQFSLRHFLIVAFIIGPLAGLLGPYVWQAMWQWNPSPDDLNRAPVSQPEYDAYQSESYYESGETPLY